MIILLAQSDVPYANSQVMFAKVERNVWLIKLAPVDGTAPPSLASKTKVMLLYETGIQNKDAILTASPDASE